MIEPELFLELLAGLLADKSRRDRCRKRLKRCVGGPVRQVIFLLSGFTLFADEPDFLLAGHRLNTTVAHALTSMVGRSKVTIRYR